MKFELHILHALKDNFVYAFVSGSECVIMDPGEAAPVEEFLLANQLKLSKILLTHHHWDHVDGVPELVEQWKCPVLSSDVDRPRVKGATGVVPDEFELFGERVRVLKVPGHTQGQIAYYFERLGWLFVGDTLFSAGCGRLKEGTAAQLFDSIQVIAKLPPTTKIYFGHEYTLRNLEFVSHHGGAPEAFVMKYRKDSEATLASGRPTTPTTLETEFDVNPFLRATDLAEFTKWRNLRDTW